MDISVNKSFKKDLRIFWKDYIINGYHTFTKGGSMKRVSYTQLLEQLLN